jgi:hypothetical protein
MAALTYLGIVQRAYQEAGLQNTGPTTVVGQVGRNADFVRWAATALEQIEAKRTHWDWNWRQGTFDLTAAVDTYDPVTDFGVTAGVREFVAGFEGSYVYLEASGVNSRQFLSFVHWPEFRGLPIPVVPGWPTVFTRDPAGDIRYFPRPNVALKAVHEYYLNPQVLQFDADVPRLPERFHMGIVWKTVMLYADFVKDFARFKSAEENFNAVFGDALTEQTTPVRIAGPLV